MLIPLPRWWFGTWEHKKAPEAVLQEGACLMGAREKALEAPLPAADLRELNPELQRKPQVRVLIATTWSVCSHHSTSLSPMTSKEGREEKKRKKRRGRGRESQAERKERKGKERRGRCKEPLVSS